MRKQKVHIEEKIDIKKYKPIKEKSDAKWNMGNDDHRARS